MASMARRKWRLYHSGLGLAGKRWVSEKAEEALQPWPGHYKEIVVV